MVEPARLRAAIAAGAALLLLHLILVQPNHPGALSPATLFSLPLELPLLVFLLLAFPFRPLRAAATGALTAMVVLKLADFGTELAFRRSFNPVLDSELLRAAWRLTSGALGLPLASAAAFALLTSLALLALAVWKATGQIARFAPAGRWPFAALALVSATLALLDATGRLDPPGHALTIRLAGEHLLEGQRAQADLARFRLDAAQDRFAALPPAEILPVLRGTDIFLIFVESYGRSALQKPLYAPTVTTTLSAAQEKLAGAGLAMISGYLTAPVAGGQSWLARASLLSGLGASDQGRYRALLASPRRTLLHLAQRAGWQTAAVVPAITLAWPEGNYFGYDRILAVADLGYRGRPFNWGTMPDQFTLAALERQLLDPAPRPPVFAEVALISSHAPWTPIPPLLPWDALGDGRVFDPFATAGDPPDVVWRDSDRVREQYRLSLEYVLLVVGQFAERRAASQPLLVVLGDHQPAPFVSGDATNRDVPIHVIGPPVLIERLDGWAWTPGLIPAPDAPVWPMPAFRDRFLDAFSSPATALAADVD